MRQDIQGHGPITRHRARLAYTFHARMKSDRRQKLDPAVVQLLMLARVPGVRPIKRLTVGTANATCIIPADCHSDCLSSIEKLS